MTWNMTPLERAEEKVRAAVMNGNGLREVMEATQHPEGTTDDSPSVAWILHAADGTTMILSWGWHMEEGAYATVARFDRDGAYLPLRVFADAATLGLLLR